jgi:glutamyl-tRNA synthetase
MKIKTRFAPSPTGSLHIGSLRTALFNYLIAKQANGNFIVRIEDTDKERSKKEFEEEILTNLKKLGIEWDEEITRQSERTEIYKKYLQKMLEEGTAYYCFCSKEELEEEREEMRKQNKAPVHQGKYRDLTLKEAEEKINNGEKAVIRLKVEKNKDIIFKDLVRGEIKINTEDVGDFVIAKDLESPLYNFSCVVDDSEMRITHLVRGEEHIPNTPKQILIAQALDVATPEYAHISLILGPNKKKLSKRDGSTSVADYLNEGYLPEAIINFVAFLGWNPGGEKEIYSMEELIKDFSIKKVQKSGAIFNIEKLNWLNGLYIRNMDEDRLIKACEEYLPQKENINNREVIKAFKERLKKISDIKTETDYLYNEISYDKELLKWKGMTDEELINSLKTSYNVIENIGNDNIQESLKKHAMEYESVGAFMWPLRVALSGQKSSAGPDEIIQLIGIQESLKRIKKGIKLYEN